MVPFVLADAALILRVLWKLSLGFFVARSREESLISLFMTSASALPRTLREYRVADFLVGDLGERARS